MHTKASKRRHAASRQTPRVIWQDEALGLWALSGSWNGKPMVYFLSKSSLINEAFARTGGPESSRDLLLYLHHMTRCSARRQELADLCACGKLVGALKKEKIDVRRL